MNYLAIDLGAGSGRGIIYYIKDSKIHSKEVHRFKGYDLNSAFWDINLINLNVETAIKNANSMGFPADYIGVDTWGVDFGVIQDDGTIHNPFHYRNIRTDGVIDDFDKKVTPIKRQFEISGIAPNEFNTLYQFYKGIGSGQFDCAKGVLFMPNLVAYHLTGIQATEPTIASTSGFYNKFDGYSEELLQKIGFDMSLLPPVHKYNTILGDVKKEILQRLGVTRPIKVVLTLGHDTASAISAIPFDNENNLFLSSGTWSLFGTLTKEYNYSIDALKEGYTNEVGVENIRFLKNIIGFWIIQQCIKKWEENGDFKYDFDKVAEILKKSKPSDRIINVMHKSFLAPENMIDAIDNYLIKTKQLPLYNVEDYANCIYTSLALEYRYAKEGLERLTNKKYQKLYIFGGGSVNPIINSYTADSLKIKVLAGINEASGLGNFLSQAIASNEITDYNKAYDLVKNTYSINEYTPKENPILDTLYEKYLKYKIIK